MLGILVSVQAAVKLEAVYIINSFDKKKQE